MTIKHETGHYKTTVRAVSPSGNRGFVLPGPLEDNMPIRSVAMDCETVSRKGDGRFSVATIPAQNSIVFQYGEKDRDIFIVSIEDLLGCLYALGIISDVNQ